MKIQHHPDDSTIMAYAAGTLTEGFSLVIAAHLEQCPHCRKLVSEAQELAGELLSELKPTDLPSGGLDDIWNRIETFTDDEKPIKPQPAQPINDNQMPIILGDFIGSKLDEIKWRTLAPGIRHHELNSLDSEKGTVRLLSIAPGIKIPEHTHQGNELTLVLRGSYQDELGTFNCGDLADLDSGVLHQPIAGSVEECVCLIATDQPLRFSGLLGKVLQPLIGI